VKKIIYVLVISLLTFSSYLHSTVLADTISVSQQREVEEKRVEQFLQLEKEYLRLAKEAALRHDFRQAKRYLKDFYFHQKERIKLQNKLSEPQLHH
jgi:hypothetical protein